MSRYNWEICAIIFVAAVLAAAVLVAKPQKHEPPPANPVTIAVPGPVAVIRVDGSTILVNEKEFTLPAGDTRFTVRVMDGKAVKAENCTAYGGKNEEVGR